MVVTWSVGAWLDGPPDGGDDPELPQAASARTVTAARALASARRLVVCPSLLK